MEPIKNLVYFIFSLNVRAKAELMKNSANPKKINQKILFNFIKPPFETIKTKNKIE
ncbi:hypothetical protein ASZ90_007197 [hydrocarbon metagenome]|uniref:Uncharacterized protein n=1 Tax=hydrocarbon metagenome TaxID=938273 RepID=A0A0W8FQ26_9ZZZZ